MLFIVCKFPNTALSNMFKLNHRLKPTCSVKIVTIFNKKNFTEKTSLFARYNGNTKKSRKVCQKLTILSEIYKKLTFLVNFLLKM